MRLFLTLFAVTLPCIASAADRKPNIVFIMADDLGYGDLGCYGQTKIKTPNIDAIRDAGMKLTNHYSGAPVCAPARCVLMTGKHLGHAFIRGNMQYRKSQEGQYPIPDSEVTIAELLRKQGYVSGGFGKWGLGAPQTSGQPLNQGFDRFFGYNCQTVAHNFYPTYLWDNDKKIALNNPAFPAYANLAEDADASDPQLYAKFRGNVYAPDLIGEQAVKFVTDHKDKPFFLYVPTTVPHLALQIPEDSLEQYEGKLGKDEPFTKGAYLPNRTPHATYAAMVTRMDRDVGNIVTEVKKQGLEDDTIFIFTSDNGPLWDRFGGTDTDFFNSNAGMRGRKGSVYEGGIRIPCVIAWKGHIKPGSTSDRVTGFEDWLPTLLELVGAEAATPKGLDGISFAPTLLGEKQNEREYLYREFPEYGGQQAIRIGDWKGVRQDLNRPGKSYNPDSFELYNLKDDPDESADVAEKHPDIVKQMQAIMKREHVKSELFPIRALDE